MHVFLEVENRDGIRRGWIRNAAFPFQQEWMPMKIYIKAEVRGKTVS